MASATHQKGFHRLFLISVWTKGLAGLLETVSGFVLLFVSTNALNALVVSLTAPELSKDSNDWIATYLQRAVQHLSSDTKFFASAYLVSHGVVKLVLVAGLLREKLWAYPASLWFLAAFMGYQCYRFLHSHSPSMAALTVIDLVVAYLIWREYQWRKKIRARK